MAAGYGKEVIEQADRLLKQGKSEPEVAKILGIKRFETVADWKRKHGIGKIKAKRMPMDLRGKNLEIWEKVQQDALEKLKKIDYSSAEEIVTALHIAHKCIMQLGEMKPEIPKEDGKKIMKLLGGSK